MDFDTLHARWRDHRSDIPLYQERPHLLSSACFIESIEAFDEYLLIENLILDDEVAAGCFGGIFTADELDFLIESP